MEYVNKRTGEVYQAEEVDLKNLREVYPCSATSQLSK